MKRHRSHLAVFGIGALFVLQFQNTSAQASQIRYLWSGHLVPNGSDDPWQIGQQGQSFALDIAVSRNAPDLFDLNVESAAFEVNDARFLLDGQEIPFAGGGVIDFTDDWSGLLDLLVFHGYFERLGQTIEIGSLAVFPTTSFQFSQSIELPPFFSSTINVDRATCCGGPYTSIVVAGTSVSVVPEPTSIALLAACSLVYVVTSQSRYAATSAWGGKLDISIAPSLTTARLARGALIARWLRSPPERFVPPVAGVLREAARRSSRRRR